MPRGAGRKNIFNLIFGIGFLGYGSYRLYTFIEGAPYTTFRLIITIGFIVLGCIDLFRYFRGQRKEDENF